MSDIPALIQHLEAFDYGTVIAVGPLLFRKGPSMEALPWFCMDARDSTDWFDDKSLAQTIEINRGRFEELLPAERVIEFIENEANWIDDSESIDSLVTLQRLVREMRSGH